MVIIIWIGLHSFTNLVHSKIVINFFSDTYLYQILFIIVENNIYYKKYNEP